jgi:preprotein translocase subunit YajC
MLSQEGGGGNPSFMIGIMLMMLVFFVVMGGPRRKEEKLRKEMLKNIQKNDRVLTRGGVLGTVIGIKGNELTLKVDEATNAKMTLLRSYVDRVLTDDEREKLIAAGE